MLFKNREKENALNIVLNCKPERGAEFYTPILDLKTKALNDIDKIDGEVTKKLKDYLSSKSDEEKYYVAELLNKQGLQDFIVKNLEEF
ncbi:hypothetical protein IKI14_06375 [bacterium]|nr:hypothetical protein [bacterium]